MQLPISVENNDFRESGNDIPAEPRLATNMYLSFGWLDSVGIYKGSTAKRSEVMVISSVLVY